MIDLSHTHGATKVQQIQLSDYERLNLANQFRILASTENSIHADYARLIRILEEGYTEYYHEVFDSIREELPSDDQRFVTDIMEMSFAMNPKATLKEHANVELDSHEASREIRFAKFLQGRYNDEETPTNFQGLNVCSGAGPKLTTYKRQVEAWYKLQKPVNLTAEQMQQIKDAAKLN